MDEAQALLTPGTRGTTTTPLRVALLGCGVVGSQVARMILARADDVAARVGRPVELAGIAVAHPDRPRARLPQDLFTSDAEDLVARDDVDIVVEVIGGIEPAFPLIMSAIEHGSSVVTANKALLAAHGHEIYAAADAHGVDVYYEAAVAGAIPIVRPLRESLVGDEIRRVMGIVNGTTNYILDKMTAEGVDFEAALAEAQRLGYAESDPTADVEGYDAAAKAAILASLAFHTRIRGSQVHREGITGITPEDIEAARGMGCVIKLLAICEMGPEGVSARVHPALVPEDHPLGGIRGANNAIFVEAREAGHLMFMGPGAGGSPTASAVMGDLVTVARNRARGVAGPSQAIFGDVPVADMGSVHTRFQLSIQVRDEPGILQQVAAVFAQHGVSLQTVQQSALEGAGKEDGWSATLRMVVHETRESDFELCLAELSRSPIVNGDPRFIRVEGM
ncbi:homoserine dehydrogenase [Acidipropionibacterium virtanenii]|uniref:Homoserine dehydrogenase n=1 Tax=Acidipropionibacterium virtanenii TaxID=2057246 RepID=A0A344UTS5_9ACTN|nr:homoserine dehydrogenase [Acidipropionibacterium virtanenii]AXE38673.1 Homoserine dehydrogenase [Acidipropionibacterium virtanenii]